MLKIVGILLYLLINLFTGELHGQYLEIPPIACPDYFQYLSQEGTFFGKLTLLNIQLGWTTVEVHFSQRVPLESEYTGNITLFEDEASINSNKENAQSISYRIDFPVKNVLPKLTQIAVNSRVLCSTSEYKPPSISYKMQHTIRVTIQSVENAKSIELKESDIPQPVPDIQTQTERLPQVVPVIQPVQSLSSSRHAYLKTICGQEGTEHSGGPILRRGEFPWLVAIYEKQPTGVKFIKGGTLISSRTIVTSAHYFKRNNLAAEHISVFLGRYNLSDPLEDSFVQRDIKTLLIHPEYKSTYNFPDSDLALLQLLAPVSFTQFIRPICLWNDDVMEQSLIGQPAVVAGWDIIDQYRTSLLVPKKVDAKIVAEDQCIWSSPAFYALTSSRTLCGGKRDGTGPCGGGNGLMLNREGRWVLRAVVSAGLAEDGKCDLSQYVVYCDIGKHMSWIKSYMQT